MKNFKKLLFLLSNKDKKRAIILLMMIFVMAVLDMIGVASIMPFMTVLTNPAILETNTFLNKAFIFSNIFGVETQQQFLFFLGVVVMLLLISSLSFKALTIFTQLRFTSMVQYRISKLFVEKYLHQPYTWFLNRHSADLGKTVLSEVGTVVGKGLKPMINIITHGSVALMLIIMLSVVNTKLALLIGGIFAFAYLSIYKFVRSFLVKIGQERLKSNKLRFTAVIEAFGAFKDIKIGGLESSFTKRFSKQAKIFAKHQASSQIVSLIPRYILEAIAFGGMLFVVLFLMRESENFSNILPILALYAFAGYRLLPSLQLIYSNATQLKFVGPALDSMYEELKGPSPIDKYKTKDKLILNKSIKLENIYYNYPQSSKTALKNINLTLPAYNTIGLVGATGSGKTTVVDIILGLLEPQKGNLLIDDEIINKDNFFNWQRSIGYVPQQIYLSDDTVAANIAFGIKSNEINQEAVVNASKIANLHDFVVNELDDQYKTTLGERGIRLSGGQRQRVGIARALYHSPKILILDEATSALDNLTEKAVIDAVNNLSKKITIILIAHRLSTVQKCDKIYQLEKGEIKFQGNFEELSKLSNLFQENVFYTEK